jgi:hypothetical protein
MGQNLARRCEEARYLGKRMGGVIIGGLKKNR